MYLIYWPVGLGDLTIRPRWALRIICTKVSITLISLIILVNVDFVANQPALLFSGNIGFTALLHRCD